MAHSSAPAVGIGRWAVEGSARGLARERHEWAPQSFPANLLTLSGALTHTSHPTHTALAPSRTLYAPGIS